MKVLKLVLSVATGCLLVGASSVVMAVGCPDGHIMFQTVPEIVIDGKSCVINSVIVEGRIQINNSTILSMTLVEAGGPVKITNGGADGNANLVRVEVLQGNIEVSGYQGTDGAVVVSSRIEFGSLHIRNNSSAVVQRNRIKGNINCENNTKQVVGGNQATGTDNCTGI